MAKSIRQEEAAILKEIAELLNEGTEIMSVLSLVLKKLLFVTGFQTGWIFLIDEEGTPKFVASEALPPALTVNNCERMKKKNCWCVNRYNSGKLDKATNIIECHRIESAVRENSGEHLGLTHHATIPLRAGNERFGLLNVGSPHKTHFQDEELALLEAIAYQVGNALKRIKLTQREQEMALISERNRLARDLHDSVNQLLFSLSLTARAGMEMTDIQDIKDTFKYIQDLSQEALSEMRSLIWQLRPRGLEHGIVSSLTEYGKMLGLSIHTKVNGVIHLPQQVEEALWRIGQEALANCKKHAQTDEAYLEVKVNSRWIVMKIFDEGSGFSYKESLELPSLGLKSMRLRTEQIGGTFKLQTSQGQGTTIEITIPLQRRN